MKPHTRRTLVTAAALLAPGIGIGLWALIAAALFLAPLDAEGRAGIVAALAPAFDHHGVILFAWWLAAAALAALGMRRLVAAYLAPPPRLAEAAQALAGDPAAPEVATQGPAPVRITAAALNALAAQRRTLSKDMERLVAEASRDVAQQRDQLGTLMAQLQQSVVVCNHEGRILLYNARALALVRRLTGTASGASGAELIGLGRSIHGVVDRALIAHAREIIARRVARGESEGVSARFVTTTPSRHLLRVLLAPVGRAAAEAETPGGFVLLLDDITDAYESETRRDATLTSLTEASRAALASMQAALDMLDYPDLAPEEREQFQAVVREEVTGLGGRPADLAADTARDLKTHWPLQDMQAADLLAAIAHRIAEETGLTPLAEEAAPDLWLSVDSFALIEAVAFLARNLAESPRGLTLRAERAGAGAHLDLGFSGPLPAAETLAEWQSGSMRSAEGAPALSVRDVAERHDGAVWFERDPGGTGGAFRFLLPPAETQSRRPPPSPRTMRARPITISTCSPPPPAAGRWTTSRWRPLPIRCSTPRPPASTPRAATRSSSSAPPASSTAGCCAASASTRWWIPAARSPRRGSPSITSPRTWCAGARASARCCRPSTPSPPKPCWWATTSPSTCAS